MEEFRGILLGLVQGVTEFLPISSSGHTVIFGKYLGFSKTFPLTLFLHLGTLASIFIFFRAKIAEMTFSIFKRGGWWERPEKRLPLFIIVGNIPTIIIGFCFREIIVDLFEKAEIVAVALMVNGGILFMGEKFSKNKGRESIGVADALLVGLAQGIGVIPGISRSGITIVTGMLRGVRGDVAATYSFLLSIPAVLGASAIEFFGYKNPVFDKGLALAYLLGTTSAFIVGWASLVILLWFIKKRNFKFFAVYCLLVGIGTLVLSYIQI